MKRKKFETLLIHDGHDRKKYFGSFSMPIFLTSTFTFDNAEQGERRFAGEEEGYIYSRLANPTVQALEQQIVNLEGGEAGLAFGSGMGAVSAALIALTKAYDHIISSPGIYGCTYGLLAMMKEKYHIQTEYCDMETEKQLRAKIRPNTACIYIETPINPTMKLIDIELITRVAGRDLDVVVKAVFERFYRLPLCSVKELMHPSLSLTVYS